MYLVLKSDNVAPDEIVQRFYSNQAGHNAVVKQHSLGCQGAAVIFNNHQILFAKCFQGIPVLLFEIHLK